MSPNQGAVPGALSNQPPNTTPQPTAARPDVKGGKQAGNTASAEQQPSQSSNSATRNYELDRTVSHVSDPAGKVARLSVAVVVDNKADPGQGRQDQERAVHAEELERLTTLTKNAVGFSAERGDSVSVINEAFHENRQQRRSRIAQPVLGTAGHARAHQAGPRRAGRAAGRLLRAAADDARPVARRSCR